MNVHVVMGRIVNLTLQSGESVCPCCRKPYSDNRNWLQKLVSRFSGNAGTNSSYCSCWDALPRFDFRIDWFDK
jgi:predicted amidophosphoribosyltransferase